MEPKTTLGISAFARIIERKAHRYLGAAPAAILRSSQALFGVGRPPSKSDGSRRAAAWWAAISAVIIVLTSCEKPKSAAVQTGPPEVLVTEVVQRDVPVIRQWVGTLNGSENADVRARTTGYLQQRAYQEGGYVKKGDLLFEIDPRSFTATLDQAKGQLEQAKATLLGVELDAKRAKELFQGKVISEEEYTNKTQDYQSKLAAVSAAQAAVEEAQLNLDYTKVVSPLDGIAGQAQAQIGDLVGTGSNTVLTTVSQIEPIRC